MTPETEQEALALLRQLRDGQNEIVAHLAAHRALAEAQALKSQERIDEAVALQREALRRQRTVSLTAVPAILACIAAIAYLVMRYF